MRNVSVPAAFLLSLILAVSAFSQSSTPSPGTPQESMSPAALLQRAHSMLPSLSPTDRLQVLSQLLSATVRKHPQDARTWLDEAFITASQVSDQRSRIYFQVQLLYSLNTMDSGAALEKLAAIDPPQRPGDDDPREGAATGIFSDFYRGHPAELQRLIAVARHLGETGTYPFGGVSNVVSDLVVRNANIQPPGKEKQEAASVFMHDAVQFFMDSPSTSHANEQFTYFLQSYAQFIPPELLKPALQELVGRLQQAPQSTGPRLITMVPGKGESPLLIARNRNDFLLARLMPIIHSVDPVWEQKLRQAPDVNRIAEKLEENSGLAVQGAYSRPNNEERTIQELQMHHAQMLSHQNPELAVRALDNVSDPVLHAAASANLALAFKDKDPQECDRLLAQARQTLEKTKSPQDRMTILYQLTHTLASMGRQEQLATAVDQSFAAFGEDRRTSVDPYMLSWVVQSSARFMPERLLEKINDVRSPRVQANLLIALARGLETEESPPRKPQPSSDKIKSKQ